ncbi:SAG-related sequence SRS55A [Toxoplasma gondii ME49]|uniref:SAG-related sequence SRS55A n=3 Tax=Toxoplasma gondii TaxID=5811 RepID=A0A125YLT2_TOXGV|nr:SAG-related sequence SRS55A [Toxoplasma gondii ME49]EPT26287.1 SAG-related sequence SRS55A [Toxoplasma gondii ME49]ESS34747.1 SAG-related sequence SRS55A [Toxoplasma gondii VEG]KFG57779.1 SAG-related sequence SRS55A [Toxoplasma gondii RUB]|eukprot:XP_018635618.1 SAG-related sequence SRS55A [Toxoplasma gondii ME49]
MGGFQVFKFFRNAVSATILIGLACWSASAAELANVISCKNGTDFVATSLKQANSKIVLKCSEGATILPAIDSKKFCKDAGCTQQDQLTQVGVSAGAASEVEVAGVSQKTDELTLTLTKNPTNSQTAYFQCIEPKKLREESGLTEQDSATQVACTIQLAIHGSAPASTPTEEKECKYGQNLRISLRPDSRKVTFRCQEDGVLSPTNFEQTFKGHTCNDEAAKVKLTELVTSASLVEGRSSVSKDALSTFSIRGYLDAYTLEASGNLNTDTELCYKCIRTATDRLAREPDLSNECKILITVSGKTTAPDQGDEPQSGDSDVPTDQPNSDAPDETPSEPDQKPDGAEKPTGSSARKSTTGVAILAVLMMFSALPYMR